MNEMNEYLTGVLNPSQERLYQNQALARHDHTLEYFPYLKQHHPTELEETRRAGRKAERAMII